MERNTPWLVDNPHLHEVKRKAHLKITLTQLTSDMVPAIAIGYDK
jgi:hypothetical protein